MPGKTNKKQSKRSAALTERNKLRQKKARERKALKRIGQAAQKRLAWREVAREKRKEDKNWGRKLPEPDPEIYHEAKNQDARGIDQVIYTCACVPFKK